MSAKPKGITQSSPYGTFLSLMEGEIQFRIQLVVVGKVVDGWRHFIVFNGQN